MQNQSLKIQERSREGLDRAKILQALRGLTGGTRHAHAYLEEFSDINVPELERLVEIRRGVRPVIHALMLALDGTLAPAYGPIPQKNLVALDRLADNGTRLVIYSNAISTINSQRLDALRARGIPFFTGSIAKPHPEGFRAVCRQYGLDHRTTWMVGDDPATDGGALNIHPDGEPVLGGMIFIRPIPTIPGSVKGIKKITLGVKGITRFFSLLATTVRNPQLITSTDMRLAKTKSFLI